MTTSIIVGPILTSRLPVLVSERRPLCFAITDCAIPDVSALLYYDYLLTLPDEIEYIWKKPKKLSTAFYFCCRYYIVANLLWTLTKAKVGLRVRQATISRFSNPVIYRPYYTLVRKPRQGRGLD
jgi:hypothetical protein